MSSFFPALAGTLCDILILPLFFYAIYSSWAKPSTPRGSAITWVLIGSKLVLLAQVSLSWAPDTYSRMSPFNKYLTIRYVNKIKLLSCLLNSVLLVWWTAPFSHTCGKTKFVLDLTMLEFNQSHPPDTTFDISLQSLHQLLSLRPTF